MGTPYFSWVMCLYVTKMFPPRVTQLINSYIFPLFIYSTIILGVLLIIAVGTLFHAIHLNRSSETKGVVPQVLISFSLISNIKKLFSPANDDGLNLDCISGIKFLAMAFIVAGHCLVFVIGGPVLNSNFWTEAVTKIENSIFLNNPLLVDTFLLLSGFLFARILLKELDKRRSLTFFSCTFFVTSGEFRWCNFHYVIQWGEVKVDFRYYNTFFSQIDASLFGDCRILCHVVA